MAATVAVRLRPARMLCASGPGQRLVTSGGPGSWEDLALHLIARFCGAADTEEAAEVINRLLHTNVLGCTMFAAVSGSCCSVPSG